MNPNSKPSERAFLRNIRTKAIFTEDDQIRVYPSQRLAAHVLGFVSNDEMQTGLSGIELAINSESQRHRGLAKNGNGQAPARTGFLPRPRTLRRATD